MIDTESESSNEIKDPEVDKKKRQHKLETNRVYSNFYYQDNKDYWKQKVTCACGMIVPFSHQSRHNKTKKHINRMKLLPVEEEEEDPFQEIEEEYTKKLLELRQLLISVTTKIQEIKHTLNTL